MCGILAVINKSSEVSTGVLVSATDIIAHRGPDDAGFLIWNGTSKPVVFAGKDTQPETIGMHNLEPLPAMHNWRVGLGHRRLSIIDITPHGHQPMMLEEDGLSLIYNGEVYNYVEIKEELEALGYTFKTHSDTEVILHAWKEWGNSCLERFNGMFAFVLLDINKNKLYAVRDRFGVKPLYYYQNDNIIAFASEVKQLRILPGYDFELNEKIAFDYLLNGSVDHSEETFDKGILQVKPGHYIDVDLDSNSLRSYEWYSFQPISWYGTEEGAFVRFVDLLKDSVRLRMRSDVPVGSALSGGLDSSTIVCLMREVVSEQERRGHLIETVTSCSEHKKYDEWEFAEEVVRYAKTNSHRVFPTFKKLEEDISKFIWHMDYPFGSTSQFSQWCVFEGASEAKLTVMIDGQGADEQLAGYGGNDLALYSGLFRQGKWRELIAETLHYKKYKGHYPWAFLVGAIQLSIPNGLIKLVPDTYKIKRDTIPDWLKINQIFSSKDWPVDLNSWLKHQVTIGPLPSLLRYEDRNSMAFSVESRVPFMDYRLIEFTLGLPEKMVYRRGERKYILREALKNRVPDRILERKDKMGFVSPEEHWLKNEGREWFKQEIDLASDVLKDFINKEKVLQMLDQMQNGIIPFDFTPWRIICMGRWLDTMKVLRSD